MDENTKIVLLAVVNSIQFIANAVLGYLYMRVKK